MVAGSKAITTLLSFNGANGQWPEGGLMIDASGNIYGTTYTGGTYSDGTLFKVAAVSHAFTTLASFNGTNGANPICRLVEDGNGNLFGVATAGGASSAGTLFELPAGSGTITPLTSFNGTTNGGSPWGNVVEYGGNLYGAANTGGADSYGTVFEYQMWGRRAQSPTASRLRTRPRCHRRPACRRMARCSSWSTAQRTAARWR